MEVVGDIASRSVYDPQGDLIARYIIRVVDQCKLVSLLAYRIGEVLGVCGDIRPPQCVVVELL